MRKAMLEKFPDFDAYQLGKYNKEGSLKRKAKKVEVEILTRFCPAAWAEYERVYAASWKPGASFIRGTSSTSSSRSASGDRCA